MKLLVTGGLGFIGSNFILKLLKESDEFEIVNVDAELYGADRRNLSDPLCDQPRFYEKKLGVYSSIILESIN